MNPQSPTTLDEKLWASEAENRRLRLKNAEGESDVTPNQSHPDHTGLVERLKLATELLDNSTPPHLGQSIRLRSDEIAYLLSLSDRVKELEEENTDKARAWDAIAEKNKTIATLRSEVERLTRENVDLIQRGNSWRETANEISRQLQEEMKLRKAAEASLQQMTEESDLLREEWQLTHLFLDRYGIPAEQDQCSLMLHERVNTALASLQQMTKALEDADSAIRGAEPVKALGIIRAALTIKEKSR